MNVYINAKNGVESKLPQNFHTYYLNVPVSNLEICMSACLYVSMSLPACLFLQGVQQNYKVKFQAF